MVNRLGLNGLKQAHQCIVAQQRTDFSKNISNIATEQLNGEVTRFHFANILFVVGIEPISSGEIIETKAETECQNSFPFCKNFKC